MPLTTPQIGRFAGKLDLVFEIGTAFAVEATWWDLFYGNGDSRNMPRDLTGYTAVFYILDKLSSTERLFETTEAEYITVGGVAGTVTVDIPESEVNLFLWRHRAFWRMELTDTTSRTFRFLEGRAEVSR